MRENKEETIWDKIVQATWWPVWRFFNKWFNDKPKEWKWNRQRAKRGYSDCDVWGFYHHLSDVIYGGLKQLKDNLHGYPPEITFEEWQSKLDDMIFAFDMAKRLSDETIVMFDASEYEKQKERFDEICKDTDVFTTYYDEKLVKKQKKILTKEECERYDRGWKEFKDYFYHLWD